MRRSSMLAQQTAGVYVAQGRGSQLHAARARCDWRRRSASRRPARASSSASTSSPSMCTRRRRSTVLEPRRACQCCCLPDGCCEPTVCGRACNASTVAVVRCAGFPPESIFHAREIEDRIQACCPYVHASFTCLHVLTCTYTRVADYGHFCMVRAVSIFDPGHSGEAVDMHAGAGVSPHCQAFSLPALAHCTLCLLQAVLTTRRSSGARMRWWWPRGCCSPPRCKMSITSASCC